MFPVWLHNAGRSSWAVKKGWEGTQEARVLPWRKGRAAGEASGGLCVNGALARERRAVGIPLWCPAGSSSAFEQPWLRLQAAFRKTHRGLCVLQLWPQPWNRGSLVAGLFSYRCSAAELGDYEDFPWTAWHFAKPGEQDGGLGRSLPGTLQMCILVLLLTCAQPLLFVLQALDNVLLHAVTGGG